MTNLEKLNEVIKETFGCEIDMEYLEDEWVCEYINCKGYHCNNCVLTHHQKEFWNTEYKPGSLSSIISKNPRISFEEEKE